ncbi:unnamed protein product [Camellia sinensis]
MKQTGLEKETIKGYARRMSQDENEVKYKWNFEVAEEFGEIGAVLVENEHHNEMYLKNIALMGSLMVLFVLHAIHGLLQSLIILRREFSSPTSQSYLPGQTPSRLKRLRKKELERKLENLQGDGRGERMTHDRIYDYNIYNDINDSDSNLELKRPVLGGKEHSYPRRYRTGRPQCKTELIMSVKKFNRLCAEGGVVLRGETTYILSKNCILSVARTGTVSGLSSSLVILKKTSSALRPLHSRQIFMVRDEEFSRQTLVGLNPYSIQLVKEWPLRSKLNSTLSLWGSRICYLLSERSKALQEKKLFMLDYHDLLLPYVKKVRKIEGTTLYGSRTLFFLTPNGTLRALAIELTRPPMDGKAEWKQVFTPTWDATGCWLWRLAKTHVLVHDSGYHQLVSHWLGTNCATEPYIIVSNRQLSAMHPIYRLLHPHFRYTMEINALAREALINANGIIETSFSPAKYCMELSSVAYDQQWWFDLQALPADLISSGMAVDDPTSPHGLKLTIEDYPFANDGLVLWDAIKQWVTDYVKHYYPDPSFINSDEELQSWWTEIRIVSHQDKKDDPWWPALKTPEDLIGILTTMIWVASGHHSAVNFGKYAFAGYCPNRPSIATRKMPTEDPSEQELKIPSQIQATKVMAVLDVLSNHSVDEEYIGKEMEPAWTENLVLKAAFERFNWKLKELEGVIDDRNANMSLKNRVGAGVVPYELLKPFSEPGVTGKGVPNSISI